MLLWSFQVQLYGFSNRKVQSKELFFLHGIVWRRHNFEARELSKEQPKPFTGWYVWLVPVIRIKTYILIRILIWEKVSLCTRQLFFRSIFCMSQGIKWWFYHSFDLKQKKSNVYWVKPHTEQIMMAIKLRGHVHSSCMTCVCRRLRFL